MNIYPETSRSSPNYYKTSTLILFAFATAFLPRIITSLGVPKPLNFLHFIAVPTACMLAVSQSRTKDQKQIKISWLIISGLLIYLTIMTASALINQAGIINLVVDYLLKVEPFLLLLAFVSVPLSMQSYEFIRKWLIRFCFSHLFLIYGQYILFMVLRRHPKAGNPDYVQGIFYESGSGHVVGASVSLTFGLYYFFFAKAAPKWLRATVLFATFWGMLLADAKQVLFTFIIAGAILLITKTKDIIEALKYLIPSIILGAVFLWCVQNIEAFGAFNTWMRPEIYGPDGEATLLKTASLRIIPTFYESPLNMFLGLGPGHTVGRLGGWMLREYSDLLGPLGSSVHPASSTVWRAVGDSWLGNQSSMFSPLFGWAGIWGDTGFFGLGAYLFLFGLVIGYLCIDDFSKFCWLTILAHGLIFSQMEEPGFMLFIAMIVGLQWHRKRIYQRQLKQVEYSVYYQGL